MSKDFKLGFFATGSYFCVCSICKSDFEGDKRAVMCLPCAANSVTNRVTELESLLALLDRGYETARNTDPESGGGIVVYAVKGHREDWEYKLVAEADKAEEALRKLLLS